MEASSQEAFNLDVLSTGCVILGQSLPLQVPGSLPIK